MADYTDEFSLRLEKDPDPGVGMRSSFRTTPVGVQALIHGPFPVLYDVNDISAGGLCMAVPEGACVKGESLVLDIVIAGKRYLSGLAADVVRAAGTECACAFRGLNRQQELKLDKLVLEMQKRYIARRKQEREAQEARRAAESAEQPGPSAESGAPTIKL